MEFKVGDKVKIIKSCSFISVQEKDGGLDIEGIILYATTTFGGLYGIDSEQFETPVNCRGFNNVWWFKESDLKLVVVDNDQWSNIPIPNIKICPRCGTETIKKQTEQYGIIDKCPNCLWC